jgi:hypothetical protein
MGRERAGRMRKAIISMGSGPQSRLLRLMTATVVPYASRHGYDVHLLTEPIDPERPAPWSKIRAFQRLQHDYDVLVWLDADLMVVDGRVDIATELEDGRFLYLVEHRTPEGRLPNSGVMMVRTGADCAAFLEAVWAQRDLIEHRWWENAAIARLLGYDLDPPQAVARTEWLRKTKLLSGRWNSIHDSPAGSPRIRHYPGYKLRTRTAFMARDLAVAAARGALGRG